MNQPNNNLSSMTPPSSKNATINVGLRIIRQLLEALIFEKIVDFEYKDGYFRFQIGEYRYQAQGYVGGFDRPRINQDHITCWHISNKTTPELTPELTQDLPTVENVINALVTSDSTKQTFIRELQQTILLCQWNRDNLPKPLSRRHHHYLELESSIDEGHPYHPSFKARTGFTIADHALYGPEANNPFQLHWIAVKRSLLQQTLPQQDERIFWLKELGLTTLQVLELRLDKKSARWNDYGLLPIHPWQWEHYQHNQLASAIRDRDILSLGVSGDYYQATISVRTLVNVTDPTKANIKLPLNIVNTSSIRSLEPHSVCTAPYISNWLEHIIQSDDYFNQQAPLGILKEYAGILVSDDGNTTNDNMHRWVATMKGQLAVIFRQSLFPTEAIPFSALSLMEADGKPFIAPWIEHYGLEEWLERLLYVAIIPAWHLLVHHGIALEAHGQNMILVHDNGWPEKILLRDFHESVEYVESYLANPEIKPNFDSINPCYKNAPNDQYYWMASEEALRELIIDTLLVFNLAELAFLMQQQYSISEDNFWNKVAKKFKQYAAENHTSIARINKIPITDNIIFTESLIRRKLNSDSSTTHGNECRHQIHNPLSNNPIR